MTFLCLVVSGCDSPLAPAAAVADGQGGRMRICRVADVGAAMALLRMWTFDVLVIDAAGLAEARVAVAALRPASPAPIVLVAELSEGEELSALGCGVTQVVPRSISPALLAIRLRRLLDVAEAAATAEPPRHGPMQIGALRLDPRRGTAALGQRDLPLTKGEFDLLYLLASRPGDYVSRARIGMLQGSEAMKGRSIDMHVCRIRRKLQHAGGVDLRVQTVYGRGYSLSVV